MPGISASGRSIVSIISKASNCEAAVLRHPSATKRWRSCSAPPDSAAPGPTGGFAPPRSRSPRGVRGRRRFPAVRPLRPARRDLERHQPHTMAELADEDDVALGRDRHDIHPGGRIEDDEVSLLPARPEAVAVVAEAEDAVIGDVAAVQQGPTSMRHGLASRRVPAVNNLERVCKARKSIQSGQLSAFSSQPECHITGLVLAIGHCQKSICSPRS